MTFCEFDLDPINLVLKCDLDIVKMHLDIKMKFLVMA